MSLDSCGLKIPLSHCPRTNLLLYKATIWSYPKSFSAWCHHSPSLRTSWDSAEKIMKHMYGNNLLTGVDSSKEAREFYSESMEVFSKIIHEFGRVGVELKGISEVNSRVGQGKGTHNQGTWDTLNAVKDQLIVKGLKPTRSSLVEKRSAKIHRYSFRSTRIFYSCKSSRKTLPSRVMEKKNGMRN